MAFKKVSDLTQATGIDLQDLFLLSDMLGLTSKKLSFETLQNSLNVSDLNGRLQEGSSYTINRDSEGLVSTIETTFGSVTKTFTFARDVNSYVSSVNIHNSDDSYDKTYTFVRDSEGVVTSITIS
jgi:hypothetical protein